jgi:hypothetical protein
MKCIRTIEAMQLTADNVNEVAAWCGKTPNVGSGFLNKTGQVPYIVLWSNQDQIEYALRSDYIVAPTERTPRFAVMRAWEFVRDGWMVCGQGEPDET